MASESDMQRARALMDQSIEALRVNDLEGATHAAQAFLETGFDHFKIRRVLGIVHEKQGNLQEAQRHLDQAIRYQPGDQRTWLQLARVKFGTGDFDAFKSFFLGYPEMYPDLLKIKNNYYALQRQCRDVTALHGDRGARDWLRATLALPATRKTLADALSPDGSASIGRARDLVRDPRLRNALAALAAIDPARCIDLTSEFIDDPAADRTELECLVVDGRDAGHPVWHIINPFFHLWAAAKASPAGAQARWQDWSAPAHGKRWADVMADFRNWTGSVEAGLVRREVQELFPDSARSPRVIDLGCGTGMLLRYLAEHCGIPAAGLHGVELHESRAACAREALQELVTGDTAAAAKRETIARNIGVGDLLALDIPALRAGGTAYDLATLFVVSGCFNNPQFASLARSIGALAPRYLMTTTVTKQWDLWHGREDEEAYYARAGYDLLRRHWNPEQVRDADIWEVIAPRKYWTNRSLSVYRRREPG